MDTFISKNKFFLILLFALLLIQLITIGSFPIIDTTEARYSGISLNMVSSNNWQIPILANHIPYLGKPPLVFWLQSLSVKFLGYNELAFRLPFYLAGILTLFFTYKIAKTYVDKKASILSVLVLLSSVMFYIESSTVSVDMFVTLFVTASYCVFREREISKNKNLLIYDLLLGVFLSLGFLTKGLVPLVYFLCPLVLYKMISSGFVSGIKRVFEVNWMLVGSVIFMLSAPWFFSVETAYPGFVKYFFYNEHFLRFVSKDYGDLYGAGHHTLPGMSWLFTFACIAPWVLLFIPAVFDFIKEKKSEMLLMYLWAFFPALMFTPSKQILMAYFSVAIPPLAIIIGGYLSKVLLEVGSRKSDLKYLAPLLLTNLGAIGGLVYFISRINTSLPTSVHIYPYVGLVILAVTVFLTYMSVGKLNRPAFLCILPILCMPLGCSLWFKSYFNSEKTTRSTKQLVTKLISLDKNYLRYPSENLQGSLPYSYMFYRNLYSLEDYKKTYIPNNEKLVIVHDKLKDLLKDKYGSKYITLVSDKDLSIVKVKVNN